MVVVFLNPRSGASQTTDLPGKLEAMFAAAQTAARIVPLETPERCADTVRRELDRGATTIAAAGGDGTISSVASALVDTTTPLGVLPLGTLNHFAKDLGIPQSTEQAVGVIAAGRTRRVDVGEVNGRIFLNNSSIGIYPDIVVERESLRRQGYRKWTAFALATMSVLRRFPGVVVRISTGQTKETFRTPFLFVGNNEYKVDGVSIGSRERLDRGLLHGFVAPRVHARDLPMLAAAAMLGRATAKPSLRAFATTGLEVGTPGRGLMRVALDGEVAHLATPLVYRVRKGALTVLTPADADEKS